MYSRLASQEGYMHVVAIGKYGNTKHVHLSSMGLLLYIPTVCPTAHAVQVYYLNA